MLFRRRQLWWPTGWGWLALALLATLGLAVFVLSLYAFLAPNDPARGRDGRGARTLVVEGWLDENELAQAAKLARRGRYERVLTTGGPIAAFIDVGGWRNFAVRAASRLSADLPAGPPVTAVPAPATKRDRTYLSALMLRDWAREHGVALDAIDLVSAGAHARRSRLLFRMALGDAAEVGVFATRPDDFDPERWWSSSSGTKTTLEELLALAWVKCCFWPGAPGSQDERRAVQP